MKQYILAICSCIVLLASCSKTKNFYDEVGKGAYLTFVSSSLLMKSNDANSAVNMVVNAVGADVESINIYVATTSTLDVTKWKLVKNIPFAGQTTLSVTNTNIAAALGLTAGNLPPGTLFYLYNEVVTKGGNKYSSANTSAPDLENQPAFNTAMKWTATTVCAFDATLVAGSYKVVKDDWQDWNPGDVVTVTAGPGANQVNISQVWPNPSFGAVVSPLLLNVDANSGAVSVADNVTFGDYGAYKAITAAGSTGFVFTCTGVINVRIHINAPPFGDQGFSNLILQKQ